MNGRPSLGTGTVGVGGGEELANTLAVVPPWMRAPSSVETHQEEDEAEDADFSISSAVAEATSKQVRKNPPCFFGV